MRKHKKWIAYSLYALLLCAALLYYRFPSEEAKDYLEAAFARTVPQCLLSINSVSLHPSFGIELKEVNVVWKSKPEVPIFKARSFLVRPKWDSFIKGEKAVCFKGSAYGGELSGYVEGLSKGKRAAFTLSLQLSSLEIKAFSWIQQQLGRRIKGTVTGAILFTAPTDAPLKGNGEADLQLGKVEVELLQPVLSIRTVKFDKVRLRMTLAKEKVDVSSSEMEGPDMRGSITGTIILNKEIPGSHLHLKGNIEPRGEFYQTIASNPLIGRFFREHGKRGKLPFSLTGTLENPGLQFM